jgi:hypothetical protein
MFVSALVLSPFPAEASGSPRLDVPRQEAAVFSVPSILKAVEPINCAGLHPYAVDDTSVAETLEFVNGCLLAEICSHLSCCCDCHSRRRSQLQQHSGGHQPRSHPPDTAEDASTRHSPHACHQCVRVS